MSRSAKALAALVLVLVVIFITLASALADKSSDVLDLVNAQRKAAGLKGLSLNEDLNRVAQKRAKEIVENWSHTRPNGEAWKTAFSEEGVSASYRGENRKTASCRTKGKPVEKPGRKATGPKRHSRMAASFRKRQNG
jgi:uncharacterized protein YkwD